MRGLRIRGSWSASAEVSIAGHELVGARFGGEGYEIVIVAIA